MDHDFNFYDEALKRAGGFLKGSNGKEKASVGSMMKKNDFIVMNKMLELVAMHHKSVEEHDESLRKAHSRNDMNRKEHKILVKDYDAYKLDMANKVVDLKRDIQETCDDLKDFKEVQVPIILDELQENIV